MNRWCSGLLSATIPTIIVFIHTVYTVHYMSKWFCQQFMNIFSWIIFNTNKIEQNARTFFIWISETIIVFSKRCALFYRFQKLVKINVWLFADSALFSLAHSAWHNNKRHVFDDTKRIIHFIFIEADDSSKWQQKCFNLFNYCLDYAAVV